MNSKSKTGNSPKTPIPKRVGVYIDGFNLYFGIKQRNWKKYYWLDMYKLGQSLAKYGNLEYVKYFTADITGGRGGVSRQQTYLAAQMICSPDLKIIKGKFNNNIVTCNNCDYQYRKNEEKMTDVNIATQLINDSWKDSYDTAYVISGDSDLVPPIKTVVEEFPEKKVLVAFPPKRKSKELESVAKSFFINERAFKKAQMPDVVTKLDGTKLHRPESWS